MAHRGRFRVKNTSKYQGDHTRVTYRSLWEAKFFRFCDEHPDVLAWSSECHIVPYLSPIDGKMHRYFPDIWMRKQVSPGVIETLIIEIKPLAQTKEPDIRKKNNTPTGRVSRRYINEVKTYGVNQAKWAAAEKYCKERGWTFAIMTEKQLGLK